MTQVPIDHMPTLDEVQKLTEGQYYLFDSVLYVKPQVRDSSPAVKEVFVEYVCPTCRTQDGSTMTHYHSVNPDRGARLEMRKAACVMANMYHRIPTDAVLRNFRAAIAVDVALFISE